MSHPSWGAWIEIQQDGYTVKDYIVAPLMGCVD